jgi:hypothetical protein
MSKQMSGPVIAQNIYYEEYVTPHYQQEITHMHANIQANNLHLFIL